MTLAEAYDIIENDEDFGDDGVLRDDFALQGFEGGDEEEDVEDIADEPLEEDDDEDI